MSFEPSFGTLLMLIPVFIKAVIIGVVLWTAYFFIKEKRKSSVSKCNLDTNPSIYMRIFGVDIKKRTINRVFLVLGALPLLVYPMVLIANVMALASYPMSESRLDTILTFLFVIFTSSYLPIYVVCFSLNSKRQDKSILVTSIPLLYVVLMLFGMF